jgi:flavin reductase (DIM6/NTAB) family NADH-FMN oxidoreductase RutF
MQDTCLTLHRAANYTSTNCPPTVSEWALSGLHASPSKIVKPTFVSESAFSIEAKLVSSQQFNSPTTGGRSCTLVVVEAVQWHVRADAVDADRAIVDMGVLRPVWRAGGITYGTVEKGFELPRPEAFRLARERDGVEELIASKVEGQ